MPAFASLMHAPLARHVCFALVVLASMVVAPLALARSSGLEATGCDSCHGGGKVPTVTLTADPLNPAVGQAITLTVGISQANGPTAGFSLTTSHVAPGTFQAFEAGTVASSSGVIHSMPRSGTGGVTSFQARWTASQATGVAFSVYALSAMATRPTVVTARAPRNSSCWWAVPAALISSTRTATATAAPTRLTPRARAASPRWVMPNSRAIVTTFTPMFIRQPSSSAI